MDDVFERDGVVGLIEQRNEGDDTGDEVRLTIRSEEVRIVVHRLQTARLIVGADIDPPHIETAPRKCGVQTDDADPLYKNVALRPIPTSGNESAQPEYIL